MSEARRPVQFNPSARSWTAPPNTTAEAVDKFHQQFPAYKPTPLVSLQSIADELGVRAVYLKDEGNRFGLPAFKILGASWGSFRAISQKLNLSIETDLETMKKEAASHNIKLYACTEGNHGRAVARMGSMLSIPVEIHVPPTMYATTRELIESEGATVVISTKSYDDAVIEAEAAAKSEGGIFIQDSGIEGYEDIPQWIVDGYSTLMREVNNQLGTTQADLVVAPVGVGSFAQSVVSHFRRAGSSTKVLTYEPDTAACLYKNLRAGKFEAIQTTPTIMAGLNCGLLSTIGWPILRSGVDATLTVSDYEAHQAVLHLDTLGVSTGPCGAGSLAALRRLDDSDKSSLGLNKDSVVVLLSTEGRRKYETPLDVSSDDPVALTQTLVQINSASPTLGSVPGPGEAAIARYIAHWLEHRDLEVHKIEPTPGRPSIVGVARGSGGGKSLMLNGHIDTVTLMGYDDDPLSGHIKDGKLYGRGAADMKSGVATAMVALANAKKLDLRGDVIFTGVADEEDQSIGTEQVLAAGWKANAALVNEPTNLEIIHAHRGFVWFEVTVHGVAGHGSRPDLGVDAISKAGYFLADLDRYAAKLHDEAAGHHARSPSVHASLVSGGEEASSYPAVCTITVEYRTIAGQTTESVKQEIVDLLETSAKEVRNFRYEIKATFGRQPFELPRNDPFTKLVSKHVGNTIGREPEITAGAYWTDCGLLADVGIKALLWGPYGEGLHAKEEWVDVESIRQVAQGLTDIAAEFCK